MALTRPTAYQINTVSTTISDPLTVLNQGSTAANIDIGFILNRSPSANVAIVWQASSNQFILANTSSSGSTNANITVSNYANLRAGNVLATTITTTNLVGDANITVTGSIIPSANVTYDLGSPTLRWREGWFGGSTIHIGDESISVDTNGKWSFSSKGSTVHMGKNDPFDAPSATLTGDITAANFNFSNGNSIFTTINSTITTANTAMKGYADAITTEWTANATTQLSQIGGANAAIVTANTAMKGYVDGQITTLVGGAPAILDTLNEIATALGNDANLSVTLTNLINNVQGNVTAANAAIVTANTALKGYTDAAITTITNSVTGANAAITTVSNSVTGANAAIVTANTAMKGYVDAANTIQSNEITAVSNSVTGANAAIVTANTALKGYTDGQISTRAALTGATFSGAVTTTELFVTSPGGDEGGQLNLSPAVTNTTLVGNVTIDVYQNKLRIWEGGGTNRGGYFDLTGLSAGVGTNLAGGGGGTPGGADSQIQFNNSSSFGGAVSLRYFSGNGVVLANAAVASTSTTTGALQVSGGIGVAGNVWCGQVYTTNNNNGTNYRIGDDAWLGGVNLADTTRLMGVQNGNNGYLQFGNVGTETLGRAGSGALTWTGTFSATNINSDNHNYANGTSIITTLSTAISTANTALKGYTDGQITTVNNSVTGANAAIVTANTALKGYTDAAITTVTNSVTGANAAIPVYTAGITAPSSPKSNDVWYDTATDITFLYINDGDSNQWVDITSTPLNVAVSTVTGTTLSISGAGSIGTTFSSGAHTITGSPTTALINGGTNGVGNIGASGATFNTIFAKSTSAQYADLAEKYTSDNEYNPGTVLIFGGLQEVTISTNSHDPTVAGVVTTNPAYLMNNDIIGVAVALTGRVPCQVKGPVNKGDRLVSSSTHGTAQRLSMSEYTPGCIIGKSLETIETNEIKLIEVAIGRF